MQKNCIYIILYHVIARHLFGPLIRNMTVISVLALRFSKTNLYFRNCFFSHQSADRRGVCRRVCEVLECYEIMYIYGKNSIYNPNVA